MKPTIKSLNKAKGGEKEIIITKPNKGIVIKSIKNNNINQIVNNKKTLLTNVSEIKPNEIEKIDIDTDKIIVTSKKIEKNEKNERIDKVIKEKSKENKNNKIDNDNFNHEKNKIKTLQSKLDKLRKLNCDAENVSF